MAKSTSTAHFRPPLHRNAVADHNPKGIASLSPGLSRRGGTTLGNDLKFNSTLKGLRQNQLIGTCCPELKVAGL